MSTALWMLEDGKYDVIILDRAAVLPAADAASCGACFFTIVSMLC
jgi:sarcosine oxidase/L-pipecolate oxidase